MTSASTGAAPSSWRARFAGGAAVRLESLVVLTVLCVVMAMLLLGLLATWIPAQRALSLNPLALLRE